MSSVFWIRGICTHGFDVDNMLRRDTDMDTNKGPNAHNEKHYPQIKAITQRCDELITCV